MSGVIRTLQIRSGFTRKPMKDLPVRKSYFSEIVRGVGIFSEEWGDMVCACHRFAKGVDFTPPLVGQPDDLCPVPHYGYR